MYEKTYKVFLSLIVVFAGIAVFAEKLQAMSPQLVGIHGIPAIPAIFLTGCETYKNIVYIYSSSIVQKYIKRTGKFFAVFAGSRQYRSLWINNIAGKLQETAGNCRS